MPLSGPYLKILKHVLHKCLFITKKKLRENSLTSESSGNKDSEQIWKFDVVSYTIWVVSYTVRVPLLLYMWLNTMCNVLFIIHVAEDHV